MAWWTKTWRRAWGTRWARKTSARRTRGNRLRNEIADESRSWGDPDWWLDCPDEVDPNFICVSCKAGECEDCCALGMCECRHGLS